MEEGQGRPLNGNSPAGPQGRAQMFAPRQQALVTSERPDATAIQGAVRWPPVQPAGSAPAPRRGSRAGSSPDPRWCPDRRGPLRWPPGQIHRSIPSCCIFAARARRNCSRPARPRSYSASVTRRPWRRTPAGTLPVEAAIALEPVLVNPGELPLHQVPVARVDLLDVLQQGYATHDKAGIAQTIHLLPEGLQPGSRGLLQVGNPVEHPAPVCPPRCAASIPRTEPLRRCPSPQGPG